MYHFNEGSIAIPDDWNDKTIHVLTSFNDDSSGLSFTISRDKMPWGMSFAEFTKSESQSISNQLESYQELAIEQSQLANRNTTTIEFSWQSTQGPIHQLMTFVHTEPHILIFTASVPGNLTETQRERVKQMLSTFKLRENPH